MSKFFDRRLGHHIIGSYALTLLAYAAPLVVVPFLARRLDPVAFGEYLFVQTVAFFVGLIVEYGFSISATRALAQARENATAVAAIAAEVLGARLVLAVAAVGALFALRQHVPVLDASLQLTALCAALGIVQGAGAHWFFQGTERNVALARLDAMTRVLAVAAILALVERGSSSALALSVLAATSALGVVLGHLVLYRAVRFDLPTAAATRRGLFSGAGLFSYRGLISLYNSSNTFFLGYFVAPDRVALYAVAERIVKAAMLVFVPFQQAVFARSSSWLTDGGNGHAYRRIVARLLCGFAGVGVATALLVGALAEPAIALFLGRESGEAVGALRLMAWTIPAVALSGVLCTNLLLPMRREWLVIGVVVVAAALNAVLMLGGFAAQGAQGAAQAWVMVEIGIVVALASAGAVNWARMGARVRTG